MDDQKRRTDDQSMLNGLPVWLRAATIIGIPGVIALYLVWVGASILPSMSRDMDAIKAIVAANQKSLNDAEIVMDAQYRLLQRICSRVSKTDEERAGCFDK